jgi:hypothetical protein
MPRKCQISQYQDRVAIDFALANAVPAVRIARLHGFSQTQISRYRARLFARRAEYVAQLRQPPLELAEIQRLHAETCAGLDALTQAQAHFERLKGMENNDVH